MKVMKPHLSLSFDFAFAFLLMVVLCCHSASEYDICGLLQSPRFQPQIAGEGKVYARYGNRDINFIDFWVTSTDSATGEADWNGISVNACGYSKGKKWSLLTAWVFIDNDGFPLDLEDINIRNTQADTGIVGYLHLCDESDCTASDVQVAFDSWGSPGGGFNREGRVLSYDPVQGKFVGWFTFDNLEHESIEVRIDIIWYPTKGTEDMALSDNNVK